MAKILFTAFMADARGKVAGTVFSKNGYGAYTRTKVSPKNEQTERQMAVRSSLSALSSLWRSLSQPQQDAWKAAAINFPRTNVFGNAVQLSGSSLFVSLNQNRATTGGNALETPPTPEAVPTTTFTVNEASGVITLVLPEAVPDGMALVIMATSPQSNGRNNLKNQYRQIAVMPAGSPTNIVATGYYEDKFSAIPEGTKVGFKCYFISTITGQAGLPSTALLSHT